MVSKELCREVLDAALKSGGDFAELFVETSYYNNYELAAGKITKANGNHLFGASLRVLKGALEVSGYTNDLSRESLLALAGKLAEAYTDARVASAKPFAETPIDSRHKIAKKPADLSTAEKVAYLYKAYEAVKDYSPEIVQIIAALRDDSQKVLIANSEGRFCEDERYHVLLQTSVVASDGKATQTGFDSKGGHAGYELLDDFDIPAFAKGVADQALTMLHADEMVGGVMTVVVHNAFGGVLLHEACVHSLEATSVAKGTSVFCGKLGQKIASDIVTAIDDGTIANAWGSLNVDDEGEPTKRNVLIENGILKSYLVDFRNSRKMNHPVTGSSRRQSYKYSPTSRMTNTFFAPGKSTFEEIIANTEYGLFAKKMGGGSVNPATGEFNFAVNEGYLIENGKITKPVRGATLVGSGAEILANIDMIADNLDFGYGMCGSLSGSIPTSVGQPTIRVKNLTVGGRGEKA
ncbi:MAG: TldD/PmbA family protein [Bacilli bacterium]|nr:TldD/PmbA family protein [Bacillota bacterium]NLM32212.1 TldD/PmbA family protein [Acholeplasmataceae bacterium]HOA77991.1 TldD/PmbA family protein [Bacilli bacterium]HPZ26798.1 TldD/PmbA family protein [Bacilli bacterium]HQC89099.1 TldD/PmbA family protein [Bacilli bacterium]